MRFDHEKLAVYQVSIVREEIPAYKHETAELFISFSYS